MSATSATWLVDFAATAAETDRFAGGSDHPALLAAGLMGEAGSVLAELKKEQRERKAYPAYRGRMLEEIGDFLWYYVRLVSVIDAQLLRELPSMRGEDGNEGAHAIALFLEFGSAVGGVLTVISKGPASHHTPELRQLLCRVWDLLIAVARDARVALHDAASHNIAKTKSRWPGERGYADLFDNEFLEEEQLPRRLELEFRERSRGGQRVVILRCNGINFGDRLTDNIEDPDGYRYHDVFHFAHAVHLGWSPVVRALLRCKRKSSAKVDEGQDGARAVILEEAVAAVVFSRAKQLAFFDGIDHVDFDLLKLIREFVHGFEVDRVPFWQWEAAILDGYRTFRLLRTNRGGTVTMDLDKRELIYVAPGRYHD